MEPNGLITQYEVRRCSTLPLIETLICYMPHAISYSLSPSRSSFYMLLVPFDH